MYSVQWKSYNVLKVCVFCHFVKNVNSILLSEITLGTPVSRRFSVMEVILALTQSHWWDKANTECNLL